jgi:CubicO group peptidase (beta-lactamase class C family)
MGNYLEYRYTLRLSAMSPSSQLPEETQESAQELRSSVMAAGLNPERVVALLERVRREVDDGLLPAVQIALGRHGRVVLQRSYGSADDDSLICIFSATKALTSAAVWLLLQDGLLALEEKVADIIEPFAANGKESVTVLQLLTHTAGFPAAPFRPLDWNDPARRWERFAQWRLSWPPGSRYEYHPTATMWVLAEIIERRGGIAFQQFIRERIVEPLGLPDLFVGLPLDQNDRVLPCAIVGDPLTTADYQQLGIPEPPETEVTEDAILNFNNPEVRAVGVPGGGGITNAATLALFYQSLLTGSLGGDTVWQPETLRNARQVRTGELKDPLYGKLVNRGLGLVIAGDEDRSYRGFGKTNSALAFGHNGAGGQLAWVDPETGISLAYLTSGHDRNAIRQARRGVAISSLAALCAQETA